MAEQPSLLSPRSYPPVSIEAVVPPTIFFLIALCVCTFRIYVRLRYFFLGWDDWFILVGMMSGIGLYITGMIGAAYGVGTHSYDLPKWELSLNARLSLFREEFYVWSVTGIKLSVAFMLLRIRGDSKLWKRGLTILIIFLTCLAISCSVFDYTQCHPVRAIWDFSYPPSACRSRPVVKGWEFATQAVFFATDVLLALLFVHVIRQTRRPLREKIVVCLLICLGLLCAAAIIPKVVLIAKNGNSIADYTYEAANIYFWTTVEVYWGIIGVSMPALKSEFEAMLKKLGLLSSADGTTGGWNNSSFLYPYTGTGARTSKAKGSDHPHGLRGTFANASRAITADSGQMWIALEGNSNREDLPERSNPRPRSE